MAWAKITGTFGDIEFIEVSPFRAARMEYEDRTRPGASGVALQEKGKRGRPESYLAVRDIVCADAAALLAWENTLQAMAGHLVSYQDSHGNIHPALFIQDAYLPANIGNHGNPKRIGTAAGGIHAGAATHKIAVVLVMMDTDNTV